MELNAYEQLGALVINEQARAAITPKTKLEWKVEDGADAPTQKQQWTAARLINTYFQRHAGNDKTKYEFKVIEVLVCSWGKLMVVVEVGLKDDEHTMASILCRDRCQAFIGRLGGITATGRITSSAKRSHKAEGLFEVCSLRE